MTVASSIVDRREIAIRPATAADADGIAAVHVGTWRVAYRDLLPADLLAGLSVERRASWWRSLLDRPEHDGTFVAQRADRILGFVDAGPSRDSEADGRTGEVNAIYVSPELTGQGIGTRLMDAALAWLRGRGFANATLWVLEGNAAGRAFYERRGWEPDGCWRTERLGVAEARELRYRTRLA